MRKIIETYKYFADRRYSTIAGTLVYFLLMSIAPFMLWLTLFLGDVSLQRILSNSLFSSVSPIINYLHASAGSAAGGASVILLVTTLYSSTNFFYHLRRSGEIVYDSQKVKGGIKLRLVSLLLILSALFLIAVLAAVGFFGTRVLDLLLPEALATVFSTVFLTAVAFTVALVLNLFACPYRRKASEMLPGSFLTTALWLAFLVGFAIYGKFAHPEQLYGAIAFVIVFLLWCYVMMSSFVIGMIYNGSFKRRKVYKKLF